MLTSPNFLDVSENAICCSQVMGCISTEWLCVQYPEPTKGDRIFAAKNIHHVRFVPEAFNL